MVKKAQEKKEGGSEEVAEMYKQKLTMRQKPTFTKYDELKAKEGDKDQETQ